MNKCGNMKSVMPEIHHIGNDWGWFVDTDKNDNVHYKKQNIFISNSIIPNRKINYNLNPKINYNFTEAKNDVVLQIKREETDIFVNEIKKELKPKFFHTKNIVKNMKKILFTFSSSAVFSVIVTYVIFYVL
jgi:hypothetical protein